MGAALALFVLAALTLGGGKTTTKVPMPTPTPTGERIVPGLRIEHDGADDVLVIVDAHALLDWATGQIHGDSTKLAQTAAITAQWLVNMLPRDASRTIKGIGIAQLPPPNDEEWGDAMRMLSKMSTGEAIARAKKGIEDRGL